MVVVIAINAILFIVIPNDWTEEGSLKSAISAPRLPFQRRDARIKMIVSFIYNDLYFSFFRFSSLPLGKFDD